MVENIKEKWVVYLSAFLFFSSFYFCISSNDRGSFLHYFIPFTLSFGAYFYLLFKSKATLKNLFFLTILTWSITLLFPPYLSNDYYRFLWDGELFWNGINVFDYTPKELFTNGFTSNKPYLLELYKGMGELSQNNYSCYPPLNQFYFINSTALTHSVFWNVLLLKVFILLTLIIGLYYFLKLIELLKFPSLKAFLLFLNPLFILEGISNVHFEGVMIAFLALAFYHLLRLNILSSSLFFAFAIQIKLIPLIFLPFLWRFLGWKKALQIFVLIGMALFLLSLSQLNSTNLPHFIKSIQLYFKLFEFNSSILFVLLQTDPLGIHWFKTSFYAPYLSVIALTTILGFAFLKKITPDKMLFTRLSIAFFIYLLLSSTVHPWYILPLLFLTILTNYAFGIVWSFTAILSYSFYQEGNIATTNWLIFLEYIPVLVLFMYEMKNGGLLKKSKVAIVKSE